MSTIINGAIDLLHDGSLPTIELLQRSFPDNAKLMISISTLLDPRYVFLIYAPILFALNKRVGHRLVIALTLAEWMNQILKWLLAGERPYWYVHERGLRINEQVGNNDDLQVLNITGIYSYDSAITNMMQYDTSSTQRQPLAQLRQFPVTCELGAGSPSGHAMVTATVWYVMIEAYLKGQLTLIWSSGDKSTYNNNININNSNRSENEKSASNLNRIISRASWSLYTLMLISVSLSRVYLACHFPHQCIGGALLGLIIAWFVCEHLPIERLTSGHFCAATLIMFTSALGTYAFLGSLGFDPLWSVEKATRWCIKKEYIHLDTTPFFSMMRYLGFCLGSGLAFDYSRSDEIDWNKAKSSKFGFSTLMSKRLLAGLISIIFGQLLLSIPGPKGNLNLFYAISFVIYSIFSYAIAGPIPNLIGSSKKNLTTNSIKEKLVN